MKAKPDVDRDFSAWDRSSSGPWEDDKSNADHLTDCPGCERCDYLIDGFYMACDQCGHWGHQDSDGWVLVDGIPFCNRDCAEAFFGGPVEIQ